MAELDLAQKTHALELAVRELESARMEQTAAEQILKQTLQHKGASICLHASLSGLTGAQQAVAERQAELASREKELQDARSVYQDLKAKEEGLTRLIERQRFEHRRHLLHDEQLGIDEAATRRWLQSQRVPQEGMNHA